MHDFTHCRINGDVKSFIYTHCTKNILVWFSQKKAFFCLIMFYTCDVNDDYIVTWYFFNPLRSKMYWGGFTGQGHTNSKHLQHTAIAILNINNKTNLCILVTFSVCFGNWDKGTRIKPGLSSMLFWQFHPMLSNKKSTVFGIGGLCPPKQWSELLYVRFSHMQNNLFLSLLLLV